MEIPFYRCIGLQRGRGFGALAQVIGRTAIPFLRNYVVPAAKCAYFLEFVVPELDDGVSGRKKFETTAKSVGWQPLRKHLCGGSRKPMAPIERKHRRKGGLDQRPASRVNSRESGKQTNHSPKDAFTIISHSSCRTVLGTNLSRQFLGM